MKKIKGLLLTILVAVMIVMPFGMANVRANEKVKVYIFEAGGCPYCEAQIEYLKGLSSYGEKFEIVQKELYIDHIDWEEGKDYNLGVEVAKQFLAEGFEDASYQGTPFVVISNIYAAAAYSENLETYINQAYEEGDKDVVSCIANGGSSCVVQKENDGSDIIKTIVIIAIVAGVIALVVFRRKNSSDELDEEDDDERLEEKYDKYETIKVVAKEGNKVTLSGSKELKLELLIKSTGKDSFEVELVDTKNQSKKAEKASKTTKKTTKKK